jgi:glycosyltransferase involved in cell wall biosynthesis
VIEGRNIVCFASDWFYDPTSKHHLMRLLSRRNHVLWVNYHGSRRPRLSGSDAGRILAKVRQFAEGPRQVTDRITVLTPLVVPMPGNRAAAALNRRILARQIRGALGNLPDRPVQIWSFAPDVDYMCGLLGEELLIYYCVDDFAAFSGYDVAETLAAEGRLGRRADLLITTSQALFEAKRHLNDNVVLVTHGVDYQHFTRANSAEVSVPPDIAELPRPVLGFWGLIQDWLDLELLADTARARPDWSIALIGEVATDVSVISGLPNVHLLGRRPYSQLPAYAKGFDVGLIPFRINALTRAVNPIKLREYLAAGLPVVSTPLPEVQRYSGLASIATAAAEFVRSCQHALQTNSVEKSAARQDAMRAETWAAKLREIEGHVLAGLRVRQGGIELSTAGGLGCSDRG